MPTKYYNPIDTECTCTVCKGVWITATIQLAAMKKCVLCGSEEWNDKLKLPAVVTDVIGSGNNFDNEPIDVVCNDCARMWATRFLPRECRFCRSPEVDKVTITKDDRYFWRDRLGNQVLIDKMQDEYLINAINMSQRASEKKGPPYSLLTRSNFLYMREQAEKRNLTVDPLPIEPPPPWERRFGKKGATTERTSSNSPNASNSPESRLRIGDLFPKKKEQDNSFKSWILAFRLATKNQRRILVETLLQYAQTAQWSVSELLDARKVVEELLGEDVLKTEKKSKKTPSISSELTNKRQICLED